MVAYYYTTFNLYFKHITYQPFSPLPVVHGFMLSISHRKEWFCQNFMFHERNQNCQIWKWLYYRAYDKSRSIIFGAKRKVSFWNANFLVKLRPWFLRGLSAPSLVFMGFFMPYSISPLYPKGPFLKIRHWSSYKHRSFWKFRKILSFKVI